MNDFSSHPLYRKHSIDSAMSSIWEFYKTRFLSLFIISLVMSLVMQYSATFIDLAELQSISDPQMILAKMKDYLFPMLVISLVSLLFTTVLHYYVIYNPLDPGNNIVVCIVNSMRYFIPYLIIMILLAFAGSLAILLGLMALIIGVFFSVVYIFTLYIFILPILMVEGPNIGNTISRTIALAHRSFWANIGWSAVFLIILIVVSIILSGIILLPFTGSFMKSIINPGDVDELIDFTTRPSFIFLSAAANALTLPLLPIFACIMYFNGKAGEQASLKTQSGEYGGEVRVEDLYSKPYSDDHPDRPDKD